MTSSTEAAGVRAVIFDVSGTTLDYGSRGPAAVFLELFARHGVRVSEEEIRKSMGIHKKDHLRAMLAEPSIAARWAEANGTAPGAGDLDPLYAGYTALQAEVLPRYCDVIPGVPQVVWELRERGIGIASTTGFDADIMRDLMRLAAEGGYSPDVWVSPDQVGGGRPAPWMAFHAARMLNVYPMASIVKVGDTPADVAEAHAAGMWAVSVVRHGNEVGLSREALEGTDPEDVRERLRAARERLAACGPHYMIDCTFDLIPVVEEISERIAGGERP
jgi:phosphonoacetaldehyde hydrolase